MRGQYRGENTVSVSSDSQRVLGDTLDRFHRPIINEDIWVFVGVVGYEVWSERFKCDVPSVFARKREGAASVALDWLAANSLDFRDRNWEFLGWQNGEEVVSFTMQNEEWDEMVANSKFKTMPAFGKAKKGRIGLQDHGDKVWFRNIEIKSL